jgi:putative hydrolase of the HAD superfamily
MHAFVTDSTAAHDVEASVTAIAERPARKLLEHQTLLLDADDTLWENNIFFEQSIAAFIEYLNHPTHTAEEVREYLNGIERERVLVHGYGLKNFRRSLAQCLEQLSQQPVDDHRTEAIARCTSSIDAPEVQLLPQVRETLESLGARHRLILVTKGDLEEQTGKLERSGLQPLFSAVEVLPEKHEAAYRTLIAKHGFEAERTWMIGNSPKSDINPALAAGLNAIHLPHPSTWVLEHAQIDQPQPGRHLMELDGIDALLHYF